jgi:hypothetical protein
MHWISSHWTEIGIIYLLVLKFLTIVQDAVDAEPAGLKPPFGKLLYYMSAIGQAMSIGNRPTAIMPPNTGIPGKTGG